MISLLFAYPYVFVDMFLHMAYSLYAQIPLNIFIFIYYIYIYLYIHIYPPKPSKKQANASPMDPPTVSKGEAIAADVRRSKVLLAAARSAARAVERNPKRRAARHFVQATLGPN